MNFLFLDADNGLNPEEIAENLDNITRLVQKSPMYACSLTFIDSEMEEKFNKHSLFEMPESFHVKMEIIVSFILFFIISICCFIMFQWPVLWIVLFPFLILIEVAFIFKNILAKKFFAEKLSFYSKYTDMWFVRSIEGTILAIIPVIATFSNFSCTNFVERRWQEQCFCYVFIFSLFNLTTFTTVNSIFKSAVAMFSCFVVFLLHVLRACTDDCYEVLDDNASDIVTQMTPAMFNSIFIESNRYLYMINLDLILPLLLILFLNRESEISYRISYHCDAEAISCQEHIKKNRNQIECLLHNIIPEHISSKLNKGRYSKNHKNIGVIFAGLVNFNDLYEESYEGGREMLRVLNELVGDYEELLDKKEYKDVEKIKTITSTFMAASGLDEKKRNENKHPHAHLFNLMMFAIDMQRVIERFNESMINFEFILNIGYNFGEVTAGVIGTTKLLFDIWGDTVNVSSRMYSNGTARRIQVPSSNIEILSEMFEFEYRGTMQIKGKGEMGTYLLVKKKDGAVWE